MSITDELRKYVKDHTNWDVALTTYPPQRTMTYHEGAMDAIADRIDAEHAEAQRRWMAELDAAREQSFNAGFDDGFASADDWLAQHEDAMREHGWVKLPKDADGEYINIGDVVVGKEDGEDDFIFEVHEIAFFSDGSCNVRAANDFGFDPWKVSHHKQPTVEDLLEQFAVEVERAGGAFDVADDVWARFAAKLRLAESEDE